VKKRNRQGKKILEPEKSPNEFRYAFGTEAKGFLRVSFCNSEERIAEGVRRMEEVLSRKL